MRILIILLILGGGYKLYAYWSQQQHRALINEVAQQSPNGFTPTLPLDNHNLRQVLVVAPANCPSEQAQRAEYFVRELNRQGIPAVRISSVRFSIDEYNAENKQLAELTTQILNGTGTPVFINGMGKSSPSLEEIIREYRRLQGS